MIVIIDYGMGNLGSIFNMLKKIGAQALISSDVEEIEQADKLILPGVGSFDNGMRNLNEGGFRSVLDKKVLRDKVPILGICLGMQLFSRKSAEGSLTGLGWLEAETVRFSFDVRMGPKVPHMGWNTVQIVKSSRIFDDIYHDSRFYFVHSYHVVCRNEADVLTRTFHGFDFASSVARDNIIGVQFHPEKSHKFGMKLLKNFAELN
ncbi:MAG: imidazole glycerol phosphate synthase subunit HisH [Geobacteraceae bacterium]|nr:imidazole glycerol phosphate synthase subunit HisH [Geobacteraceae bacterium]